MRGKFFPLFFLWTLLFSARLPASAEGPLSFNRSPDDSPKISEIEEQGDGKLIVHLTSLEAAKRWREELSHYFHRKEILPVEKAIQKDPKPPADLRVELQDVLPPWTTRCAGTSGPTGTNCFSTALYLAHVLPNPACADGGTDPTYLVPGWLKEKLGVHIPFSHFRALRLGDVISATSDHGSITSQEHVYFYLGHGLIFEHNSRDQLQECNFSQVDADYLPLHEMADFEGASLNGPFVKPYTLMPHTPPVGFRLLQSDSLTTREKEWHAADAKVYAIFKKVNDQMVALWEKGTPIPKPTTRYLAQVHRTFVQCKDHFKTVEADSPKQELYLYCYKTLANWRDYFKKTKKVALW